MAGHRSQTAGPSLWLVVGGALALRLAFLAPGLDFLPAILERRPELSTPVSSFMAVKEALHLQHLHKSSHGTLPKPYASGTLHLPPLLLALLEPLLPITPNEAMHLYSALIWSLADAATGVVLADIFTRKQRYLKRIQPSAEQAQLDTAVLAGSALSSPGGVAAFYMFNPLSIATCLARSTSVLNNLAIALAVNAALRASPLLLGLASAFAILISLYPVLFVPSLVLLCATTGMPSSVHRKGTARRWSLGTAFSSLLFIVAATALGVYISFLAANRDWSFVGRAYGTILLVPDLSPNIGLWWYFFIEIFDHFRDFFLLSFNVHAASYALPLAIKYRQDPLFAVTTLAGLTAMLKSYPTLGDAAIFMSLLSLHREIAPYLRHPLFTALLYTLATLMMPALHYLWLDAGSGNANFFYATTLIWAFASGACVLDAMWAWGRWRWESDRPRLQGPTSATVDHKTTYPLTRKVLQA